MFVSLSFVSKSLPESDSHCFAYCIFQNKNLFVVESPWDLVCCKADLAIGLVIAGQFLCGTCGLPSTFCLSLFIITGLLVAVTKDGVVCLCLRFVHKRQGFGSRGCRDELCGRRLYNALSWWQPLPGIPVMNRTAHCAVAWFDPSQQLSPTQPLLSPCQRDQEWSHKNKSEKTCRLK